MIILSLLQRLGSRPPYTHTHYWAYQIATVLFCRESLMCLVDATAWVKHNQIERGAFMLASTALFHKVIAQKTSGKKLPIHQPKFTSSILHTPNSPSPSHDPAVFTQLFFRPKKPASREVGTSTATNQQAISGEGHFGSIRAL